MARGPDRLRDIVRRRIRELRRERGFTQEELCERAGISIDAISRIEGGSRVPTLDTIDSIAKALAVSPLAFFDQLDPVPEAKQADAVRRIVALLDGRQEPVLRLAEDVVAAIVRAHRALRRPPRRRSE